jgi:DNA-binding MarR family transcriptional regulator
MAIDPVCGMEVNELEPAASCSYQGEIYYFCAKACQRKFEESPLRFAWGERAKELSEHIRLLVRRYYSGVDNLVANSDLTHGELVVIGVLGKNGRAGMSRLAGEGGLALSTMTGLVDRLVKKRYVKRYRTEDDRRMVLVELTQRGRKACQAQLENDMQLVISILEALPADEQESFLASMRRIRNWLER